jgi:hypothetical protein
MREARWQMGGAGGRNRKQEEGTRKSIFHFSFFISHFSFNARRFNLEQPDEIESTIDLDTI